MCSHELLTVVLNSDNDLPQVLDDSVLECIDSNRGLLLDISGASIDSRALERAMRFVFARQRPLAFGLICSNAQKGWVSDLSHQFAQSGIVIGDFVDPKMALIHTVRERMLSLADACYCSASRVRKVKSSKA